MIMRKLLKAILPDRDLPLPILRGPFRGATVRLNPRHGFRKVFGLYEHELNGWVASILPRVDTVLDIGASEGYFTFGCAAGFRRLGKSGTIIAFEPDGSAFAKLERGVQSQQTDQVQFFLNRNFVGAATGAEVITLDEFARQRQDQKPLEHTLIKIDVEGAEMEVIAGASLWLNPTNYFLIEVHWDASLLQQLNDIFSARGLKLRQINQKPLPILGYEARGRDQWWLVSERP
jgi:hypothetical protein